MKDEAYLTPATRILCKCNHSPNCSTRDAVRYCESPSTMCSVGDSSVGTGSLYRKMMRFTRMVKVPRYYLGR